MNSMLEIADAYRDFHSGKYGKIDYEKQKLSKKLSSAGPRLKQVIPVYSAAEPAAPKYLNTPKTAIV
ncbi:hypothetical protein SAMN04488505_10735 [Chitinophaga rupis]|uniref:Uncharacterized protein n=1 Tax=Chitinophaga rupis TaxID=573321 RepID=A0A1H8C8W8_9BACT|nr:hypothetical protein [Chitinophaga rupis]SEM91523.1 hypothetical protein SAMN04488505_10735 [Chitinophaga rupis]